MNLLYWLGWSLSRLYSLLCLHVKVTGRENLPMSGPLIVASNHISYFDPPVMGSWVNRELHFFAKKQLFDIPVLGPIIRRVNAIPVRRGTIDRDALEQAVSVVGQGGALVVFPEGTRSRTNDFLPPRSGVGVIAHRAPCTIVPVYVHGLNHPWRCFFFRQRASISFGEPFPAEWVASMKADRETYDRIAHEVMTRIAELRETAFSR